MGVTGAVCVRGVSSEAMYGESACTGGTGVGGLALLVLTMPDCCVGGVPGGETGNQPGDGAATARIRTRPRPRPTAGGA